MDCIDDKYIIFIDNSSYFSHIVKYVNDSTSEVVSKTFIDYDNYGNSPDAYHIVKSNNLNFFLYRVYVLEKNNAGGFVVSQGVSDICNMKGYLWRANEVLDGLDAMTASDDCFAADMPGVYVYGGEIYNCVDCVTGKFSFYATLDINIASKTIYFLGGKVVGPCVWPRTPQSSRFYWNKQRYSTDYSPWGYYLYIVAFNWETGVKRIIARSGYKPHNSSITDWEVDWDVWAHYSGGDILNVVKLLGGSGAPKKGVATAEYNGDTLNFKILTSIFKKSEADTWWGVWAPFRGMDFDLNIMYETPRDVLLIKSSKGYSQVIEGYQMARFLRVVKRK